ncbi:eukaryotic translation initiation factor 2-alpha kinase [Rhodotorula kratochvilovae]
MEDPGEVQEREIEVLQAIYGDEFQKAESRTAWKTVNAAHEFRVCIRPVEEDLKDKVQVWVRFKLPQRYPKLSTLQRAASSRLGDEMVYDLCSQAATYITERHATQEANRRAEALKEQQEAEEAARLSQLISEDVRRKEEVRLERERRERELDRERETALLEVDSNGERKVNMPLAHSRGAVKVEVTVRFGFATFSGEFSHWLGRIFSAELLTEGKVPRPASAYVVEVLAPYFLTSQGRRKLSKIEADLDRIHAIQHPHILPVTAYRIVRYSPSFFPPNPQAQRAIRSGEGWTVLIATPPIRSQTLEDLLSTVGELRPDRALSYFTQLVSAVEHLHLHNIVHRAIRPKAVFVSSQKSRADESGEAGGVKLSGAGWYRRLIDLNKAEPWLVQPGEDDLPDSWTCPEALTAPFTYDRSRDMYELGVVLAQMVFGLDVVRKYGSPAEVVRNIPRNAPTNLKRILTDLLLTESKKRPTASRLAAILADSSNSSATLQGPLVLSTTPPNALSGWNQLHNGQKALTPLVSPPPTQLSRSVEGPSGFFWQPRSSGSRYRAEFEELEFLGRGGGGQVVKARNKLDGHLYAIKKIRLPSDKASEAKLLREVTIWSRMNHPNIVRYHTSWTEIDESFPGFGAVGSPLPHGAGTTGETRTTDSQAITEQSSGVDSDDSDATDSVVDFDEDSTPGAELDIDFGDALDDDLDFLSVGHAQSHSVSYPSIHFGNEDDPSRAGSEESSPVISKHGFAKKGPKPPSPTAATPKQTRTLYIQAGPFHLYAHIARPT